jgi:hypothetical protein
MGGSAFRSPDDEQQFQSPFKTTGKNIAESRFEKSYEGGPLGSRISSAQGTPASTREYQKTEPKMEESRKEEKK